MAVKKVASKAKSKTPAATLSPAEGYLVEHDFPVIGRRMLLNARRIAGKTGATQLILLAMKEVA